MIRFGLCCKFHDQPIKFHTTTALYLSKLSDSLRSDKISELCLKNSRALLASLEYCHTNNIGCFRVNSRILPLKTHPDYSYGLNSLEQAKEIKACFNLCRQRAKEYDIRLTFHPDQFILLSAKDQAITRRSIEELAYQAEVSELIGADVINIHAGGGYGDKPAALKRVSKVLAKLDKTIRDKLTLENDDRVYTPADLLDFCQANGVPFVYDLHHHRCLSDQLSTEEVTVRALKTWNREPLFHISSPKCGWQGAKLGPHHDYIDIQDFPHCWLDLDITVEVEAKAKELAVNKLRKQLRSR
ncbi:MAG: UV DNA damage repair endonuclease UvsE [Candidatus Omnitrophica bacterium]|nr:UV DNA damage repair endonuclease UvsE [Candidatus Omnitrophota bacterium]